MTNKPRKCDHNKHKHEKLILVMLYVKKSNYLPNRHFIQLFKELIKFYFKTNFCVYVTYSDVVFLSEQLSFSIVQFGCTITKW